MAPPYNYAAVSVSNVVATFCQYEALKHVSFPMQVGPLCWVAQGVHGAWVGRQAPGWRRRGASCWARCPGRLCSPNLLTSCSVLP